MQAFNHTQSSSSATWVVDHNLNVASTVSDVLINIDGALKKVLPLAVVHNTANQLTITFSSAQTGSARIISSF